MHKATRFDSNESSWGYPTQLRKHKNSKHVADSYSTTKKTQVISVKDEIKFFFTRKKIS
jgi:hypothetical protein